MSIRVAINGFGRMGKLALQAGWNDDGLEFVHINEIKGNAECHAHLLQFDSIHGRWGQDKSITSDQDSITIGGKQLSFSQTSTLEEVDWAELGIDLVLECTGKFKTPEKLQPYFNSCVK